MDAQDGKKLRIAVLAYGSLTLNLSSPYYEEPLLVSSSFQKTPLKILTSFQDITALGNEEAARVCLLALSTPNEIARKTPLFYAEHKEKNLDQAVLNLMKREGMDHPKQVAVIYNTQNKQESFYSEHCFAKETIFEIENWLTQENYDVALLAQFHPKFEVSEVIDFLEASPEIKKRTLQYYQNLPPPTQMMHQDVLFQLGLLSENTP